MTLAAGGNGWLWLISFDRGLECWQKNDKNGPFLFAMDVEM